MKLDKYEVGKRYGKALFQLANDNDCVAQVYEELQGLKVIFNENHDLGQILDAVHTSTEVKEKLLNELVSPFSPMVQNFLHVVYQYKRMSDLPYMVDAFSRLYDDERHYLSGTIKSVVPLTEEQITKIEQKIAKCLGYANASFTNELDPSIIGGFVVEAHNFVIDRSLQQQINMMARALNL